MEYGMTGVNGVQRLLLQSHKEYTAGVESWSETVLGRDPLGNVSGVKERGRPSTVILWGYKGLYPVAVVENASVSAVTTALGLASGSSVTAGMLRSSCSPRIWRTSPGSLVVIQSTPRPIIARMSSSRSTVQTLTLMPRSWASATHSGCL